MHVTCPKLLVARELRLDYGSRLTLADAVDASNHEKFGE